MDKAAAATLYLGIDLGLAGALAFYAPASGDLEVLDVPVYVVTIAKAVKSMRLHLSWLPNISAHMLNWTYRRFGRKTALGPHTSF
jgi:hypothetical protein